MQPIELHITFRSRQPGSFGGSPPGRLVEWVTQTWLRFTCFLFSSIIVIVALSANMPPDEKTALIVLSPALAIIWWYAFLFMLLVCRYLGIFGKLLAHFLIIYFYLFSRLIVQRPPRIDLPLA